MLNGRMHFPQIGYKIGPETVLLKKKKKYGDCQHQEKREACLEPNNDLHFLIN